MGKEWKQSGFVTSKTLVGSVIGRICGARLTESEGRRTRAKE